MLVDRHRRGEVDDRLDGDAGAADPVLDQVDGGGAEPLDGAGHRPARGGAGLGGGAAGGEVGQVEVEVEPGPGRPWLHACDSGCIHGRGRGLVGVLPGVVAGDGEEVEGGLLGGDHPEGFGLADLELVLIPEGLQLGGLVADEVVEGGQVEGVAGDIEVGGAVEPAGVVVPQGDVPASPALLLLLGDQVGVERRDRVRHGGLDRLPPARREPGGELLVHVRGRGPGEPVGGLGDLPGPVRLHRQLLHEPPDPGQPELQVQRVRDQRHPRGRGDPQRRGDRLRRERRHRRGPLPAQGLIGQQHAGSAPGRHPGVDDGGVQHRPLQGQPELAPLLGTGALPADLEELEHAVRVEVVDLDRVPVGACFEHASMVPEGTDIRPCLWTLPGPSGEDRR
ncbi:hypothetical protein ACT8ZV_04155 [Nocardioides sp. MAHUQ-72]|uniref:hypothetical protein n=1 Tax=unclassified Nocardioides TaxID=2615069 RepID=UPI003621FE51